VALAVVSRFVIDLRLGPRTLSMAAQLVASVALCGGARGRPLLMLIDDYPPYPAAILQVFGQILHRRRRHGRGRRKHPALKPPPGLLVGVVHKVRDHKGNLLRVRTRARFGRLKAIRRRIVALGLGRRINTAHVERLNGTLRGHQARLARRTQAVSRAESPLQWGLWLFRDLYNGVWVHGALRGRTPAMAMRLTDHVWTVLEYVRYPVHVDALKREIWAEERREVLTSALEREKPRKTLPTS
jgi:hypothetical protein